MAQARKTPSTNLTITPFAHATAVVELIDEAGSATRSKFAIPALAHNTSAQHVVASTRKATRANFFVPTLTNFTSGSREVEVDQTGKTTGLCFAPSITTFGAPWNQVISRTREAQRSKLGIAAVTD